MNKGRYIHQISRGIVLLCVSLLILLGAPWAQANGNPSADQVESSSDKKVQKKRNPNRRGKSKKKVKKRTKKKRSKTRDKKKTPTKKVTPTEDLVITLPAQDVTPSDKTSEQAPGFVLELAPESPVEVKQEPKKVSPKATPQVVPETSLEVLDFGGGDDDDGDAWVGSDKNRFAFEQALSYMASTDYGKAADEFYRIIQDPNLAAFHAESQYQLAKALFKSGLYGEAFQRFKSIIREGPNHRRFQKSVEWLFRLSRVSPEQEPILRELARFRNMQFPQAYRDEYHYLLAKHFFFEARRYEKQEVSDSDALKFGSDEAVEDELQFSGGTAEQAGDTVLEFQGGQSDSGEVVFEFGGRSDDAASGEVMEFGRSGQPRGVKTQDNAFRARAPESLAEAVAYSHHLIERIASDNNYYPRGLYLTALLFYLVGEDQKAVETYRSLVGLLHPSSGTFQDVHLRHMAFLSLARIHYEHEQFDKSIYYYSRIPQGSETWLVALFESSWAYFRRGDFDKALGRLLTLHSPFFASEYFPESQVVKAIIYFEACRYAEARVIVDDFFKSYNPMMEKVRGMLDNRSEVDAASRIYETLSSSEGNEKGDDVLTSRLLGLAMTDPRVAQAEKTLAQLLKERSLVRELLTDAALIESLEVAMDARIHSQRRIAAEATLLKFEEELETLRALLSQSIKVKLEVARAEREGIEKRLRGESGSKTLKASGKVKKTDSEHVRWPYQGEYWRDELGTYVVDFSMCEPLNEE